MTNDVNARSGSSRRGFLTTAATWGAAASFPTIVPASALGKGGAVAPSERIGLGVIGYGPRCTYDLGPMLAQKDVRCVAVCDVQAKRRDAAKARVDEHYGDQACASLHDFREVLDRKDVDAVLIATGDRWHAHASILAARAGKDVYSEKPCGLTIELCQKLADAIRETGRVFQAGTQRRSVPNFRFAVDLARSGKLGKLKTLYASVYTPSIETQWLPGEPTPDRNVVDWDLWLGPAPWRPYNHAYVEGRWRGQYDFDSGARLLDWGAHTVDLCQWANDADATTPISFEPSETRITARYANGVELILDFLKTPFGERTGWITSLGTCPVRFVGEEGWVETGDNGGVEIQPGGLKSKIKDLPSGGHDSGLDVGAHARNWLDCIKSREKPAANAEVMRRSHIACHAAASSWILGRKLEFDPVKEAFVNDDEANGLRTRPFREAWRV
ncbi:Gfo/Idh/MocA family protein [Planctomyces sp. SH-PL62]|uniref:Gfo/Idh/MocA family protein n=1 Tax=Planctomyces sp. SH-PL62 TaxID=1636152 RepID=UPI00078D4356|nr:Gfo/Idh/MocA family oxidoreductase [Planctomyces sp. SH-PL62]AMV36748.1 Inositol 2-dehydrogenase [Planctomyces sp. SH-PL62]